MENRGTMVALESDLRRMTRIRENSERLGTTIIQPAVGDAATYREGFYDKILIDAPCSGLGVLRRHPDGRWTKTEKMIGERAQVQRRILENCAGLLKPGGALVYATCTTEQEENEDVITSFHPAGNDMVTKSQPPHPKAAKLVDEKGSFVRILRRQNGRVLRMAGEER
jgi:16S rRNA (cytosine967-C5)-methyltransferase